MDVVEVDGLAIGYERVGHGPPLVLLHGYVGDGPATWRPQLDGLSDDFTVIAWDAPGAGTSADPPPLFGMAQYADCLAGFISTLLLGRPHIAGLSFGGALAIELCHRHPTAPSTLVLASAYAGWRGSLPAKVAEQRLQQALTLADLPASEFTDALLPTMFSPTTPRSSVDQFGASLRSFHPAGFRAMALACAEDIHDALADIAVPTLLIYGDADVRAPLTVAEDLHAAIPESTLIVLPGVGHICNIEAPDAFNHAVRRFIRDAQI